MNLEDLVNVEGLVFLSHFCERHGPSVILCSSKLASRRKKEVLAENDDNDSDPSSEDEASVGSTSSRRMSNLFTSPTHASSSSAHITSTPTTSSSSSSSSSSSCGACKSLDVGEGFVTTARGGRVFCTTTKFPEKSVYGTVRHACVRSLSCEHVVGREGPVVFGEHAKGLVVSMAFSLPDSQARGFSRTYALCIMHKQSDVLMQALPFVTSYFVAIQNELREKAQRLFDHEQRLEATAQSAQSSMMSPPPTSSITLRRVVKNSANKTLRTLEELTGMRDELYRRLHVNFCDLLFRFDTDLDFAVEFSSSALLISLYDLMRALGTEKFCMMLREILLGRSAVILYQPEPRYFEVAEKLHYSMRLFFSHGDSEALVMAERTEDTMAQFTDRLKFEIHAAHDPNAVSDVRLTCASVKPVPNGKLVLDVLQVLRERMDPSVEHDCLEALLAEFEAISTMIHTQAGNKFIAKLYQEFGLTESDVEYVKFWGNLNNINNDDNNINNINNNNNNNNNNT